MSKSMLTSKRYEAFLLGEGCEELVKRREKSHNQLCRAMFRALGKARELLTTSLQGLDWGSMPYNLPNDGPHAGSYGELGWWHEASCAELRETTSLLYQSYARFGAWCAACLELPQARRVLRDTQSCRGVGSPHTRIKLWDLFWKYPSPMRLEKTLRRTEWRTLSITGKKLHGRIRARKLGKALLITRKVGRAALICAAYCRIGEDIAPTTYREIRKLYLRFVRETPVVVEMENQEGVRSLSIEHAGLWKNHPEDSSWMEAPLRETVVGFPWLEAGWGRLDVVLQYEILSQGIDPRDLSMRSLKKGWKRFHPADRAERLHAFTSWCRIMLVFGSRRARAYVEASEGDLHFAGINLPKEASEDQAAFLWKHRRKPQESQKLLARWDALLAEGWKPMGKNSLVRAEELLAQMLYGAHPEARELAKVAAECGYTEEQFHHLQNGWRSDLAKLTHQTVPAPGGSAGLSYEGLQLKQLEKDDPRAILAGALTGCCQHPEGVGSSCAWHAHASPNGAIWAVFKHGRMLAQSWVWREGSRLVLDNIEAMGHETYVSEIKELYERAAAEVIGRLGIDSVYVGTGYAKILWEELDQEPCPISAPANYSDAHTCWQIADVASKRVKEIEVRAYPASLQEIDNGSLAALTRYQQEEEGSNGTRPTTLWLGKHAYALGYRGTSGFFHLDDLASENGKMCPRDTFSFLKWLKEKATLGLVRADCRKSTSYKLVQAFARRGRIVLLEEKEYTEEDSGEQFVTVMFQMKRREVL